jgi:hypothetical protein
MAATLAASAYSLNEQRKTAKRNERFARAAQAEQAKQAFTNRSTEANQRSQRARAERARLRAMSAETGLSGVTTDSILRNVDFQVGRDVARIQRSGDFDQTNSRYRLQSNLNQIQQPDYVGAALNTGLALYTGYRDVQNAGNPANAPGGSP